MSKILPALALVGLSSVVFASGAYFGLNYSVLEIELKEQNHDFFWINTISAID